MNTWIIDFEYCDRIGKPPRAWCVVGSCVETGKIVRLWLDGDAHPCPFPAPFRMVAHYAAAELSCFQALGWQAPAEVVDSLAEARVARGQRSPEGGWGLLSIARSLGIASMSSEHKDSMRKIAMEDEVPDDRKELLIDYCYDDVVTTARVWEKLSPHVDLRQAVIRGRYLKALAAVESRGIPVDEGLVRLLMDRSAEIKDSVWRAARLQHPGTINDKGSFSSRGWLDWCSANSITWPLLESTAPRLDADTFKVMSDRHPEIQVMACAKKLRGQTNAFQFPLHAGRLRCMLSPFGSDTGRNQPSNSKYIFGASAWLRSVIQAPPGKVLAYIDYSSQEFALAAALSQDKAMTEDYNSGDPYMAFARRGGAVPQGATKSTHPNERATYKVVALAVQYGMEYRSLAARNSMSFYEAKQLISQHKEAYPAFWKWRQAVIDTVRCGGTISTPFGWKRSLGERDTNNSIANFLVQASGAEVLRVCVTALEEAGFQVVAPVHDAVMVELNEHNWESELSETRQIMASASQAVVPGVVVRTDVDVTMPGEHFVDGRGTEVWDLVAPVIGRDVEGNPVPTRNALES